MGGENIHPQDLENLAVVSEEIDLNFVVAIGVLDEQEGTERPVLICGLKKTLDAEDKSVLVKLIQKRIFNKLGISRVKIFFVNRKWIVRTNNGKKSRSATWGNYKNNFPEEK